MPSPRVAGAVRLEFASEPDAEQAFRVLDGALIEGLEIGGESLALVRRGRVVTFGLPNAVTSLLGPARAVPR